MIVLYIENKQIINPLIRSYIPIVAIYNTIIHNLDISWYNINIIIYIYTIIYIHWIHHIHHQIHNWIHPIVYTLIYRELKKNSFHGMTRFPHSPWLGKSLPGRLALDHEGWKKWGSLHGISWFFATCTILGIQWDIHGISWVYILYIYIFVW